MQVSNNEDTCSAGISKYFILHTSARCWQKRNYVSRLPVRSSEYIGFLSNNHCWLMLPRARKAILFDRRRSCYRGLLVFRNSLLRNNAVDPEKVQFGEKHKTLRQAPSKMKYYNGHRNCSSYGRRKSDTCNPEINLRKEMRKTKERWSRNGRCLEGPYPVSNGLRPKPEQSTVRKERHSKPKDSKVTDKKVGLNNCSIALKPSVSGAPVIKAFPMLKIDKFLFFLILFAWAIAGVRNLILGFSDVSRPPGRGF